MPTFLSNDQYAKFDGANFLDQARSAFNNALNGVQDAAQSVVNAVVPQTPTESQTPPQQPVTSTGVGPAPSTDTDFLSGLRTDFTSALNGPPPQQTPTVPTPSDSLTNPLGTGNAATSSTPAPTAPVTAPLSPSNTNGVVPSWLTDLVVKNAPDDLKNNPEFINIVAAGSKAESGWDPKKVQPNGGGRGLFQFDINGGMGTGLSTDQLFDPQFQASRIIPQYAAAFRAAPAGLSPAEKASWVAAHAEKPYQYDDPNSVARRNYAKAYDEITSGSSTTQTAASAPSSPKPTATTVPNQFGLGLSQADAAAFCGPVAAMALAQRFGNGNIPLDAVKQAAADSGWTSNGGMNGVENEQKLLTKLGVPTKLETNVNWTNVQRDATSGNPVIISTAGHYFVVDGYDPKTGAYHVGQSGLALRNGSDWMTTDQISAASKRLSGDGTINGALYADNPTSPVNSVAAPEQAPQDFLGGVRTRFQQALNTAGSVLPDITNTLTQQAQGNSDLAQVAQGKNVAATAQPVHLGAEIAAGANQVEDQASTAINPARDVPVLGGVIDQALNPLTGGPLGALTTGADAVKLGKAAVDLAPKLADAGLSALDRVLPEPATAFANTQAPTAGDKIVNDALDMFAKQDKGGISVPKPSDVGNWIEQNLTDKFAPINKLGPESEQAAANFQGRTAAAVQRAETEMAPVIKTVGEDLPYLNVYRKLQVDLERATANGGDRLASAGVTSATDAQNALTALEQRVGPESWNRIQQADSMLQSSLDNLLQDKVDSGLVSQKVADTLTTLYPHYNPVRVLEAIDSGVLQGVGRKLTQNSNTLRRLTEYGSEGDTETPVRSAIRAIVEGDVAIQRNDVAKQIASDVLNQGLGQKVTTTTMRTGPDVNNAGNTATVVLKKIGDVPGTVSYFDNGVRKLVSVPQDVEHAVKALDDDSLGKAGKVLSLLNAPLRKGATTLNPTFIPTNMASDAVTTFVREGWDAFKRIPQGYVHALKKDQVYQDFIRSGGGMESYFNHSPRDIESAIKEAQGAVVRNKSDWAKVAARWLNPTTDIPNRVGGAALGGATGFATAPDGSSMEDRLKRAGVGAAAGYLGNPMRAVEGAGAAAELGPRLATFQSHLAQGETAGQAALAGRRVTVDFARSGNIAKSVNSAVPFLNAQIQGTLNVVRTLKSIPSARVRFALLASTAAATFANNQRFSKEYADIPDYVKDQYAVFIMGPGEPDPSGVGFKSIPYVAIPLREWSAPYALISHELAQVNNSDPRSIGDFTKSMLTTYAPSNATSSVGAAGSLAPAPARYLAENALNTRFYSGSPIVSSQFQNTPPTEQYDQHTGPVSKAIAQKLGWSPKGLDFLLSENFGGLGRIAGGTLTPPLVRSVGGQTLQDKYTQYDQMVNSTEGKLADLVSASPQYQSATRDRQVSLQQTANVALRDALKQQLGIPKTQRDTGLPNHYIGVTDKAQEQQIDAARTAYNSWRSDPRHVPRPPAAQMQLALRYENRVNPRFTVASRQQTQGNASERALVRKVAPTP